MLLTSLWNWLSSAGRVIMVERESLHPPFLCALRYFTKKKITPPHSHHVPRTPAQGRLLLCASEPIYIYINSQKVCVVRERERERDRQKERQAGLLSMWVCVVLIMCVLFDIMYLFLFFRNVQRVDEVQDWRVFCGPISVYIHVYVRLIYLSSYSWAFWALCAPLAF